MKASKLSWKKKMLISHVGLQETAVCFMVLLLCSIFVMRRIFFDNSYMQKIAMPSILIKLTIATTNSFSMFLYGSEVSLFPFIFIHSHCAITLTLQYNVIIHATGTQVHINYEFACHGLGALFRPKTYKFFP
jgi:hypothetical protein